MMFTPWIGRTLAGLAIATGTTIASLAPLPVIAEETFTHEMGEVTLETTPTRFAVSNWALTESLIALGIDPVAIPESDGYRAWVVEPKLPENFTDLGTRREPNFEALRDAKPDAILISADVAMAHEKLSGYAPTLVYSIYNTGRDEPAIDRAEALLRNVAKLAGKPDTAEDVITSVNARIEAAAKRIRDHVGNDAKFAVVRILDDTHFPYVEPIAPTTRESLFNSAIWKAMPFARNGNVHAIPASWTFGGVLSAARFAELLADAVTGLDTSANGS